MTNATTSTAAANIVTLEQEGFSLLFPREVFSSHQGNCYHHVGADGDDTNCCNNRNYSGSRRPSYKCLVLLFLLTLTWAVLISLFTIDIAGERDIFFDSTQQTVLEFEVSSTTNVDHYKKFLAVGGSSTDAYYCRYRSGFGYCHNRDTEINICFTPEGPHYNNVGENPYNPTYHVRTYPFGLYEFEC